jgi:hypothetical protein
LRPGVDVTLGVPRSSFALVPAERSLFVAVIREVHHNVLPCQLVCVARSVRHFTFGAELIALFVDRVRLVA